MTRVFINAPVMRTREDVERYCERLGVVRAAGYPAIDGMRCMVELPENAIDEALRDVAGEVPGIAMKAVAWLCALALTGCATGIAPSPDSHPDARVGLGTLSLIPDGGAVEEAPILPAVDAASPDARALAQDGPQAVAPDVVPRDVGILDAQTQPHDMAPDTAGQLLACIPGASAACACATGLRGAQVCGAVGTFGPCDCIPPPPDASPVAELVIDGPADLGTVMCSTTSAPAIFTIRNIGETAADHVSVTTNGAPIWLIVEDQCTSHIIAPLTGQCTVGVEFAPYELLPPRGYGALLTVSFDGGAPVDFALHATAVSPCGVRNWPSCVADGGVP